MPDLHLETEAGGIVAGVDEVGRGPWAGPVVAAAVILDAAVLPSSLAEAIDDSKRLSARRREDIARQLPACARIGIGAAATGSDPGVFPTGLTRHRCIALPRMRRRIGHAAHAQNHERDQREPAEQQQQIFHRHRSHRFTA